MSRRRFDWDEIRRLYASGLSIAQVAEQVGASKSTIKVVINPDARAKTAARQTRDYYKRRTRVGNRCPDCGKEIATTSRRCIQCHGKRLRRVRADTLQCVYCHRWLPDEEFYASSQNEYRRWRTRGCKECGRRNRRQQIAKQTDGR